MTTQIHPPDQHWTTDAELQILQRWIARAPRGAFVEIGAWAGRSTVALAQACAPLVLHVIDHWRGQDDEGPDHPTVAQARYAEHMFRANLAASGCDNVLIHKHDAVTYLDLSWGERERGPISFCFVDAGHTYQTTRAILTSLLPHLAPQALICGHDMQSAHAGRVDLDGGVERAVREVFPDCYTVDNLWYVARGVA